MLAQPDGKNNVKSLYIKFLSIFTAITILIGALIGFISYFECEAVLKSQFSNSLLESSKTINNMIGDRVSAAAEIISLASQRDFVINADIDKIRQYAENAVELSNYFYNIYYFSSEAKLAVAAYSDRRDVKMYIGLDYNGFKNEPNMQNIHSSILKSIELKSPMFSGFFYSPAKKLLFTYIVPVIRNGKVNGVISAAIYANDKNFQTFINALKSNPDQFISLFDSQKRLIAATENAPAAFYTFFASLDSQKIVWRDAASDTEPCLIISRKEPNTAITTVVGINARAVGSTLANLRGKIFSYALICILSVIFISFIFAGTLVRPIKALIDGLKRVDEGVYSYRIEHSGDGAGEIDDAIKAFNKMNEKLYKTKVIENIWNERWND